MGYLLGIDLGTSSLKSILIDYEGRVAAIVAQDYQFASPVNGYAEHNPEEWWQACCLTIKKVIKKAGIAAENIKGISFSGQMHGLVTLDSNYQVVRPVILHCDARTSKQVQDIKAMLGEERVKEWIMNPIYSGFLLPSLLWIREVEPGCYERIKYVMLPKDYIKLRLTGEITSDYSDASATLAFNIKEYKWSDEIMEQFELNKDWFPACCGTTEVAGAVSAQAARETGLIRGTKVVAGGGDQVMQGIGNGITQIDGASVNIGTSGQVSFQSDTPVLNPKLSTNTFCGYKKGRWITMGAIMNAGLSFKWFSNILHNPNYKLLDEEIMTVAPGSGGVIFLPYLNGERTPHLNPDISGEFLGLNLNTERKHMARAVMEGVTYALNQCRELCGELGLHADYMVASGGGAKSLPWLHVQADVYGMPLRIADTDEQAGLGAAIAAGVGIGVYDDIEEGCQEIVRYKDFVIEPDMNNHKIYQEYYEVFKEAYQASQMVLEKITQLGRRSIK